MGFSAETLQSYKDVFELKGKQFCVLLAAEELMELAKELLKNINRGKDNLDDIIEEVADVLGTMEYVRQAYDITDEQIWRVQDEKTKEKWLARIEQMKAEAAKAS